MFSFIFIVVAAWFLLSVGIGVYKYSAEAYERDAAIDVAKESFLFPYKMIKSLFKK